MSEALTRRELLNHGATAAATAGLVGLAADVFAREERPPGKKLKKAVLWAMLPEPMPVADRFKLAADIGFDGIEAQTVENDKLVEQMHAGADKAGIRIHSVMNMGHWQNPLSSDDPEVVKKGVALMKTSIRNAHAFGADTVLLVPAVVNAQTRYQEAYARSQKVIREEILPAAREARVVVGVENVWNKFLLSPLEFARYVDEFKDEHLRAYFDVGNNVLYGFPEDWILTLGPRISKIHLKDFKRANMGSNPWVALRDGDIDWPAVRKALDRIGYEGFLTAELPGGDEAYLRDVARRIDLIVEGK